ncbi:MAG TPA: N-acetyltransferase [Euryarchaeota archaeon]|nr:N-acetyltransferase [Euryarchaeota archaeon]
MNKAVIRTVRPHDLKEIDRVERRCFGKETRFPLDALANMIASSRVCGLVVEVNGIVRGFLFQSLPKELDQSILLTLDIDPDFRRQGYASSLLTNAAEIAKSLGRKRFILQVGTKNHAAISLYQSRGYKKTGLLKDFYGENGDAWEMELKL